MTNDNEDPYSRDENVFRTDGRDVCHWCSLRPQAWLWGPYRTRVCDHCDELITAGRGAEVVEECAARITVRTNWHGLDAERWRAHEHARIARWLEIRTERSPIHEPV